MSSLKRTSLIPGEVVWAQLDGYPYWPAKIAPVHIQKIYGSEEEVVVMFFDKATSYGLIREKNIKNFGLFFDTMDVIESREFKMSICAALEDDTPFPPFESEKNGRKTCLNVEPKICVKLKINFPGIKKVTAKNGILKIKMFDVNEKNKRINEIKRNIDDMIDNYPFYTKNCESIIKKLEKMGKEKIIAEGLFKKLFVLCRRKFDVDPIMLSKRISQILEK